MLDRRSWIDDAKTQHCLAVVLCGRDERLTGLELMVTPFCIVFGVPTFSSEHTDRQILLCNQLKIRVSLNPYRGLFCYRQRLLNRIGVSFRSMCGKAEPQW